MNPLIQYNIPIKGLNAGLHSYQYKVDAAFFKAFEASPIKEGVVEVTVEIDKRSNLIEATFEFSGTVKTTCDRCLVAIHLPVEGNHRLLYKYSTETKESDDIEVVFIHPETAKIDLSIYIYEFIILAVPLIKTYDCENDEPMPCDEVMLDKLEIKEEENDITEPNNPFKDAFKDWNK